MQLESGFATVGAFEVHYTSAGPRDAEPVVLSHGLARSARDFDPLVAHLAPRYRVVCPDMIGRGLSQWSASPSEDYCLARYVEISCGLLDALGLETVRWVGTSMGGTIGIRLAGEIGRVSHLLLNDTGPVRAPEAIRRIARAIGEPPVVATLGELEAFFRRLYASCGERDDASWRRLTETSHRRTDDGLFTCQHDPRIVEQFTSHPEDLDLWPWYDRIEAKARCLRGSRSDLLTTDVASAMATRGPRASIVEIEGVGHAPNLDTAAQMRLVADFLAS